MERDEIHHHLAHNVLVVPARLPLAIEFLVCLRSSERVGEVVDEPDSMSGRRWKRSCTARFLRSRDLVPVADQLGQVLAAPAHPVGSVRSLVSVDTPGASCRRNLATEQK